MTAKGRPYPPEKVREAVQRILDLPLDKLEVVDKGVKGAIIGLMNSAAGGDAGRYKVMNFVLPTLWAEGEKPSTKDLGNWEWMALNRWLNPGKATDDSPWSAHPAFNQEVKLILSYLDGVTPEPDVKPASGLEHEITTRKTLEQIFIDQYGYVPLMYCGHRANERTALGNPVCTLCADGGKNKIAYEMMEVSSE